VAQLMLAFPPFTFPPFTKGGQGGFGDASAHAHRSKFPSIPLCIRGKTGNTNPEAYPHVRHRR
jgi:hypothetical protein